MHTMRIETNAKYREFYYYHYQIAMRPRGDVISDLRSKTSLLYAVPTGIIFPDPNSNDSR